MRQLLKAGPLTAYLESDGGLRQIKWGADEVLMRLYVAVRDQDWGTIAPVLSDVQVTADENSFQVKFRSNHLRDAIAYHWDGVISGSSTGVLSFIMSGESDSDFLSNRIGFCLLHSMDCADHRCRVTHSNADITDSIFPTSIAPDQPFKDITAIGHHVSDEIWADISLSGEVFEMEDQRNWTDASYKTYCTPLSRPFPVQITSGSKINQSVTISIQGEPQRSSDSSDAYIHLYIAPNSPCKLPSLGLELTKEHRILDTGAISNLAGLNLSHLRIDIDLDDPAYPEILNNGASLAKRLNANLEIAILCSPNCLETQIIAFSNHIEKIANQIQTFLVLSKNGVITDLLSVSLLRDRLATIAPSALVGGGTDYYFAELNRGHDGLPPLDALSYSINPQVHATDDLSIFETLAAQQVTVEMARTFQPGAAVAVSPVTLKPRHNPNKTSAADGSSDRDSDPRQRQPLAATWTLGCTKYLTEGGANSITLFETFGPRGVMDESGTFPLYNVLKSIGEFAGADVRSVTSSNRMAAIGLCLNLGSRYRLIIGNMSDKRQYVCADVDAHADNNAPSRLYKAFLEPYAVQVIDWVEESLEN